jgi:hypothetical protein
MSALLRISFSNVKSSTLLVRRSRPVAAAAVRRAKQITE